MKTLLLLITLFVVAADAATVRLYFTDPLTNEKDTNAFYVTPIGTNILSNGGVVGRGIPTRYVPASNGYRTNTLAVGHYSITNRSLGAGVVIRVPESSSLYDYTNLLVSGYNIFVTIENGTGGGTSGALTNNETRVVTFANDVAFGGNVNLTTSSLTVESGDITFAGEIQGNGSSLTGVVVHGSNGITAGTISSNKMDATAYVAFKNDVTADGLAAGSYATGGKVKLIRNGVSTNSFTTITGALVYATSGDLVEVSPGTYWEKDLLRKGVNYYFHPGANLYWIEPDTNGNGHGFFDERACGATTNTIVLRDTYFMTATNLYYFAGAQHNMNYLGCFVFTNPATLINMKVERSRASFYEELNRLGSHLFIADIKTNSVFEFDEISRWTGPIDLYDDDLGQPVVFPPAESGITWEDGDFYARVNGTLDCAGYYGIWGALGGTSERATNAISDAYFEVGVLNKKYYVDCSSIAYRSWLKAFEIRPGIGSYRNDPITILGSGRHYIECQKISGFSGADYVIDVSDSSHGSTPEVWIKAMKISLNGALSYMQVQNFGNVWLDVQHWDGACTNGLQVTGASRIIPKYSISGLTNVAAAATSLVVGFPMPMPTTNYAVTLTHAFNPVATSYVTSQTPTNFTITYSLGVTGGGNLNWSASLNSR